MGFQLAFACLPPVPVIACRTEALRFSSNWDGDARPQARFVQDLSMGKHRRVALKGFKLPTSGFANGQMNAGSRIQSSGNSRFVGALFQKSEFIAGGGDLIGAE